MSKPKIRSDEFIEINFEDAVFALRNGKWFIILCTIIAVLVASIFIYYAPNTYQATATLLIGNEGGTPIQFDEAYEQASTDDDDEYFLTQVAILNSKYIALKVIEKLGLKTTPTFIDQESIAGKISKGMQSLLVPSDGVASVELENKSNDSSYLDDGVDKAFKHQQQISGSTLPEDILNEMNSEAFNSDDIDALNIFDNSVEISPIRKTKLIDIKFKSQDPTTAALIANAIGRVYIDEYLESRNSQFGKASDWLYRRTTELEEELQKAEINLNQYKLKNGLVEVEGDITRYDEQRLQDISSSLIKANRELTEAKVNYDQVAKARNSGNSSLLDNLSAVQLNGVIQTYKVQKTGIENELARLSNKYGTKHPEIRTAVSRLNVVDRNIRLEIDRVVKVIEKNYENKRDHVASLERDIESAKTKIEATRETSYEFGQLQRLVDSNRKLYETFLDRLKETGKSSSYERVNARLVAAARVPFEPAGPYKKKILLVALMLGAGLSAIYLLLRQHYRNTLNTAFSLEKIERKLGVQTIGTLPKFENPKNASKNIYKVVSAGKEYSFIESIRTLCASILYASADELNNVTMICSSLPNESKTTASASIAFEMSKTKRTLLIDGDVRRASLHSIFNVPSESPGLLNAIKDPMNCLLYIRKSTVKNLDFLSCGRDSEGISLLSSQQCGLVMKKFKKKYDVVIVDSTPIFAASDALHLVRHVDNVVYLVRSESTNIKVVEKGVKMLENRGSKILGLVVTYVDKTRMVGFGGRYYGYHGFSEYYTKN